MVPQIAQKPFKLTENYTAPKGAMIVPSCWSACMQVGSLLAPWRTLGLTWRHSIMRSGVAGNRGPVTAPPENLDSIAFLYLHIQLSDIDLTNLV